MSDTWAHKDISEFRARAKHILRRNLQEISDVLNKWSNGGNVRVSHFKIVRSVYAEYFFRNHWDVKPSARNVRESISIIKTDTQVLQSGIARLDPATLYVLSRAAERDRQTDFDSDAPNRGWTEVEALELSDVIRAIESLSRWAETALQAADVPRLGKPPRHAKLRVLRLLGGLYEELTGKRAYARTNPIEGGEESGPFRRFANDILAFVGVEVTDATVRQAKAEAMAEKDRKSAG